MSEQQPLAEQPPDPERSVPVVFDLPEDKIEQVKLLAIIRGTSFTRVVRQSIATESYIAMLLEQKCRFALVAPDGTGCPLRFPGREIEDLERETETEVAPCLEEPIKVKRVKLNLSENDHNNVEMLAARRRTPIERVLSQSVYMECFVATLLEQKYRIMCAPLEGEEREKWFRGSEINDQNREWDMSELSSGDDSTEPSEQ